MTRQPLVLGLVLTLAVAPPATAQPKPGAQPPAAPTPEAPAGTADPVVASVDGRRILLSDVGRIVQSLPPSLRSVPFDKLYPDLLDRLVDHLSMVMLAKRYGLDSKPDVQQDILSATDRVLEGAYLAQSAVPEVTEEAIRQRYDQLYRSRPITEEVHARHILVGAEAEARALIGDLKQGADFITLARVASKDPDGEKGGDLGFFRRTDVSPAIADTAFSIPPGQVAPDPVKNEFGWHVVKVEEKRQTPPPSYGAAREQIRQDLLAEAVRRAIQQARGQVLIHRYNVDGTEIPPNRSADATAAALLPR
jgi:peptidyl-prolyl cis-trans isomerase C